MNFESWRSKIAETFQAGFVKPGGGEFFPVEYENNAFKQPINATWCRFSVRFGERALAAIGHEFSRVVGFAFVQIFCAEEKGVKDARAAADKLAAIFDNLSIPTTAPAGVIVFQLVNLTTVGKTPDGWYQSNASVQFHADATQA